MVTICKENLLVFLMILAVTIGSTLTAVALLQNVDQLRHEFLKIDQRLWNESVSSADSRTDNNSNVKTSLLSEYLSFERKLEQAEWGNATLDGDLNQLMNDVKELNATFVAMQSVNELYENFTLFAKGDNNSTNQNDVLDARNVFIRKTFVNNAKLAFWQKTWPIIDKYITENMLNTVLTPQQIAYCLYQKIALNQLKGYVIVQFALLLRKLEDFEAYKNMSVKGQPRELFARDVYKTLTSELITSFQTIGKEADNLLWRRDPETDDNGKTYLEVTNFLTAYMDMINAFNGNTRCTEGQKCNALNATKLTSTNNTFDFNVGKTCAGRLVNCVSTDVSFQAVCRSKLNTRNYEYLEAENGDIFGHRAKCNSSEMSRVEFEKRIEIGEHCEFCRCLCESNGNLTENRFSLLDAMATVTKNRVMTGLRFIKKNHLIQLQIAEGRLLSGGQIDPKSISWLPVRKIAKLRNGKDMHKLTWEQRAFDLNEELAPTDHVVTGVRLRLLDGHLRVQIQTTPFEFTTGNLQIKNVTWQSLARHQNKKNNSTVAALELMEPDAPIRWEDVHEIDSNSTQFVEFQPTNWKHDLSQTTVPFLDAQSVIPAVPVPIIGVGMYHKGYDGSGGYIAPSVRTFNLNAYLANGF